MQTRDLILTLALSLLFSACQKKASESAISPSAAIPPSAAMERIQGALAAAKNPDPKMVAKFETLSAADAAFDKKIHSAKGLQTLSSSERERLTRENADMVFYGIEKGDFKVHQKLEELDPNLGMVPFDPNVRSRHGDTFLTAAVKAGSKPYVEEFLRKGTDPALKDGNGKTALELANELNRKDLAALLKGNK